MLTTYLINAGLACLLGAGTNELAIIAILRYILPRKKSEIARRIRDIISTDLLSPDKMRDKLDDPQVVDLLYKNINETLCDFLNRDLPAPATLFADHMDEMNAVTSRVRQTLLDEFTTRCGSPQFAADVIQPFLLERWTTLKHRSPGSLFPGRAEPFSNFAQSWVTGLEDSASLRRGVTKAIGDWLSARFEQAKTIADLLSPGMISALEDFASSQSPMVIDQLANALREPKIRDAITTAIMAAIDEQVSNQGVLGGVKGALVNVMRIEKDVQGVCRRLPDTLRNNLTQEDNSKHIGQALRDAVRNSLQRPLDPDLKTPAMRRSLVDMLLERLWRPESFAELGTRAHGIVMEIMGRSFNETIMKMGVDPTNEALLNEAAQRCRRVLVSNATCDILGQQFDELLAAWKDRPLGRLERYVSTDARTRVATVIADEVRGALRHRLNDFAQEAGVWDIVTDSVEGYDDKQIADMVTQLARGELRAVTILGGVIGVVVGVLQTFFQSQWKLLG